MRSPAGAIAWEFRRRYRPGVAALALYFIALASMKIAMPESGRVLLARDAASFALVVIVPLTAAFIYLLGVFSFGMDGDLAARHSMYPARMFTLPVTSGALAAWPMAFGCGAAAALWIAARVCAVWPSDLPVPLVWPGLLAACLLAWTQALTWMPYPARGLRVVVAVLWLCTVDTIVLVALHYHARESVMLALLAPHVPLAYVTARIALVRARRGDVPHLREGVAAGNAAQRLARGRPFRSPARAQRWFEWRRHGRSLPVLVAMVLPFELALLFVFRDTPAVVLETLLIVVVTPGFMAGFVAATAGRPLSTFTATRPLSAGSLVAPALEVALWSTAAAWLLIVIAVPVALTFSDTWPVVIDRAVRTQYVFGTARAVAIVLLGCAGLFAWTWKRLVQGLYLGLTGRAWLVKANVFGTLALLVVTGFGLWLVRPGVALARAWDALPWILGALAILKTTAALWLAVRVFNNRLVSDRTVLTVAACWCGAVFALYGVLVWFVDTPYVPRHVLLLAAIVAVPLARVAAAPLALARGRHQ